MVAGEFLKFLFVPLNFIVLNQNLLTQGIPLAQAQQANTLESAEEVGFFIRHSPSGGCHGIKKLKIQGTYQYFIGVGGRDGCRDEKIKALETRTPGVIYVPRQPNYTYSDFWCSMKIPSWNTAGNFKECKSNGWVAIVNPSAPDPSPSAPKPIPKKAISIKTLPAKCQEAIRLNQPTTPNTIHNVRMPNDEAGISQDIFGDLAIYWSRQSGEFYRSGTSGEMNASRAIGAACPKVAQVVFGGATWQKWYMRRNRFTIEHGKGSGLPGDWDYYWNNGNMPLNYDPNKNYDLDNDDPGQRNNPSYGQG